MNKEMGGESNSTASKSKKNNGEFKRGIKNSKFIDALNVLYADKTSFWYKMVNNPQLYIAIRDNYINVYYKGQSLCKLAYCRDGKIKGETNHKYINKTLSKKTVNSYNGLICGTQHITSLDQVEDLINNAEEYALEEKKSSYGYILSNKSILDVEITFNATDEIKRSSIDYLEATIKQGKLVLNFYEAKHCSNAEIVSRTEPKVFEQLDRYEKYLISQEANIQSSYKLVCNNILDLNLSERFPLAKTVLEDNLSLVVNRLPYLIIFGESHNSDWDKHVAKLRTKLQDRLILKEN